MRFGPFPILIITLLISLLPLLGFSESAPKFKVLLVLAHPDDETMMGPLLMKFKDQGVEVGAIYATQGEGGEIVVKFENPKNIKKASRPPSEMAKLRMQELALAASDFGFSTVKDLYMPDN